MKSLEIKSARKRNYLRSQSLVSDLLRNHEDVIADLAYVLDVQCQHKLAAGRDDLFGSVVDLRCKFDASIWPSRFADLDALGCGDELLKAAVFETLLTELHRRGDIVLVGDRQRARSRAFEVVHYLRRLKQRTHARERLGIAPELVDMVKVEVQKRERPVRSVSIDELLDGLEKELNTEVDFQLVEEYLSVPNEVSFEYDVLEFAIDCFRTFLKNIFGEDGSFPVFQQESFYILLKDAFKDSPKTGRVIAAGTGFGKTEAFLFPLLFYTVCVWYVRGKRKFLSLKASEGFSGLLLYPRIDLCNNQAERLLKYVLSLNEVIKNEWEGDAASPLKIAIAHSRMDQIRIQCPLCVRELGENDKEELDRAYIVADDSDGNYRSEVLAFKCERNASHSEVAELLIPQIKTKSGIADFGITTVNTLHRRLMDDHGQQRLFKKSQSPPRFVIVDEMHIYEGQAGSHVAHILRRCRQRIKTMNSNSWNPIFVGASATAGSPAELASRMFDAPKTNEILITPVDDGKKAQGLEYFFFLQSSGSRFLEREDEEDDDSQDNHPRQFVSEQATMIQAAMCLSHNIKRPSGVAEQKRRTLGFIDSIDVATRLARNLDNAEWQRIHDGNATPIPLYALRFPIGVPNASDSFEGDIRRLSPALGPRSEDSQFQLPVLGCSRSVENNCVQPPHPLLERCERYESGECWHAMARQDNEGLVPLSIQVHKSGSRKWGNPDRQLAQVDRDNWRLLISTSALEVGFDHPELIATWQYHAPPSISSFVQRKGRGGRGITDFPITMVVLGKSFGDVFRFQDHLKLVEISEDDIASVLDESNPSIREQHLFSALLDFCAHSKEFKGAYNIRDIEKIADACDSSQARKWLGECFGIKRGDVESFTDSLKKMVLEAWNKTLNFDSLEPSLRPRTDLRPSDLFLDLSTNQLTEEITKLNDPRNKSQNPTTLLWLKAAHKAATEAAETGRKITKIIDFCRFLPQQFICNDIYVPSTTIPVPIGRFITVIDGEDRHLGVESSEFGLKCFLPGGFKIRYNNLLWMAPWEIVPNKPREPGSSRIWVGTQRSIGTRNKISLDVAIDQSTLDANQKAEIVRLLGNDCLVGVVDTLRVQCLGSPKAKKFSMERSTLRIVRKRPEDADGSDYLLLARDPHVTSKYIYIPESNEVKSNVPVRKLPFMSESKIRFYDRFKLTLCFYANLVNCYPEDGDSQTIVLRFWDEEQGKPIAPAIQMRTQAMEFRFDPIENCCFTDESKHRIYWARLDELIFDKMVIDTGALRSVYLVPSVIEALKLIEPQRPFCERYAEQELIDSLQNPSVANLVDREIIQWCLSQIDNLSELIDECRLWCETIGFQRSAIDSLASALSRVAAHAINVSPTMFRRKTFFSIDGPRLILFDDVEGGSGNVRRLRDVWQGNEDLERYVANQLNCPAAEVDSIVFAALDSDLSPEALSQVVFADSLPSSWVEGKREQSATRAKLRLQRLAQSPDIAAFYFFVRQQWRSLKTELGRGPSWLRVYRKVLEGQSLDIRADNLKRDFLDKDLGSPSELKARVQELMPLCESACPECLLGEMFAEREFVDREVLATFLSSGSNS